MDYNISDVPEIVSELEAKCKAIGFTMPSDRHIGSLLRTLVLSKRSGRFLELGTGMGLSLAWMVDGLTSESHLISIDNDPKLISIVRDFFKDQENLELLCDDGGSWLENYEGEEFDLIFADAWPGKYRNLDRAFELVKVGGFYLIDDMNDPGNWPEGHAEKVDNLVKTLDENPNFMVTKFDWSTGVILATKIS